MEIFTGFVQYIDAVYTYCIQPSKGGRVCMEIVMIIDTIYFYLKYF
jgi:hypothetical protein